MAYVTQTARYRYRVYLTLEQKLCAARVFGHVRWVWNEALALKQRRYTEDGVNLKYRDLSAALTQWKRDPEKAWLKDVSSVPLQQVLRHLNRAYTNFFRKKARFPRFKCRGHEQKAEFTRRAFTWDGNQGLSLAKLGQLKVRWSRPLPAAPSTVTLIREPSGKYFISCVVQVAVRPLPETGKRVGIDLGLTTLGTLSQALKGTAEIPNPRYLQAALKELAQAQRTLSRRTKGSGRWHRQRLKVARLHERVADCRRDALHKVTTALVEGFDALGIENLRVKNLLKNRRLARSLSDAGFGLFRDLLSYKCEWYGRELQVADAFFPSSQLCSTKGCGYRNRGLKLGDRHWDCPACGTRHHRDQNAAKNLEPTFLRWDTPPMRMEAV